MSEMFLMVLGMSFVTLAPRVLPLVLEKVRLPRIIEEWIKGIPYAALAALTIPGVLHVDVTDMRVGILGLGSAVICGIFRCPLYITVFVTVSSVYVYYLFI